MHAERKKKNKINMIIIILYFIITHTVSSFLILLNDNYISWSNATLWKN